jgi:flagellar motor protein MotB
MRAFLRSPDSEVQVWPSYTDVAMNIILILLLYLFTQIVFASQAIPCQQEIRVRQTKMHQAVDRALDPTQRSNVTITENGSLQRYTFADRILFESGQSQLSDSGKEILKSIGSVLKAQVGSFSQIQIEGHTDDRKIRGDEGGNWELSSARATAVVRFLQETSALTPELLSATGYSQYHPVDNSNTEMGRARNRRIEIVLVYLGTAGCERAANTSANAANAK